MGKRQRSETNDENSDASGKRSSTSSEFGRPFPDLMSPVMTVSGASQPDNEVDIVWAHSPPPMNLKLCSTPGGPKTRRRSDFSSKDIADMIECINSRNNSQQSPIISTPPLIELWMQGRQEGDASPVVSRFENRASRRTASRKPLNDKWAALAKDLHVMAELSQTARIPAPTLETDSDDGHENEEDVSRKNEMENLSVHFQLPGGDQNGKLTNDSSSQNNLEEEQKEVITTEHPMEEFWEDDSWFENESFVKLATQIEEQASSQKVQMGQNTVAEQNGGPCSVFEANSDVKDMSTQCQRSSKSKQQEDVNSQFVSPPKVNRLGLKKTLQSLPSSVGKPPSSDRDYYRSPQVRTTQTKFQGNLSQFSKKVIPPTTSVQIQATHKESIPLRSFASATKVVSQFGKKKTDGANKAPHKIEDSSLVTPAAKPVEIKTRTLGDISASRNGLTSEVDQQTGDCDVSIDLFDSSLVEEGLETTVKPTAVSKIDNEKDKRKSQMEGQVISNLALENHKQESEVFSDNSLLDEELLAAVEKEEEQWNILCSQRTEKIVSLKVGTRDECHKTGESVAKLQFQSLCGDEQKVNGAPTSLCQPNACRCKEEKTKCLQFKAPILSQFASSSKLSAQGHRGTMNATSQFCSNVGGINNSQGSDFHPSNSNTLLHGQSTCSNKMTLTAPESSLSVPIATNTFVSSQSKPVGKLIDKPRSSRSTFQFGKTKTLTTKSNVVSHFASQNKNETQFAKSVSKEVNTEEISSMKSQFSAKLPLAKESVSSSGVNSSCFSQSSQFSGNSQSKTQDETCLEVTPSPVFAARVPSVRDTKTPPTVAPKIASSKSAKFGEEHDGNESPSVYDGTMPAASKGHARTNPHIQGQSSEFVRAFGAILPDLALTNKGISFPMDPVRADSSVLGQRSQFMRASGSRLNDPPLTNECLPSSKESFRTNSVNHRKGSQFERTLGDKSSKPESPKNGVSSSVEPLRTNASIQGRRSQFQREIGNKAHDVALTKKPVSSSSMTNSSVQGGSSQFVKVTSGNALYPPITETAGSAPLLQKPTTEVSPASGFQSSLSDGQSTKTNKSAAHQGSSFQFRKSQKMSAQLLHNPSASTTAVQTAESKGFKETRPIAKVSDSFSRGNAAKNSRGSPPFGQFNSGPEAKADGSTKTQEGPQMVSRDTSKKSGLLRSKISSVSVTKELVCSDVDGTSSIMSSQGVAKGTCSQEEIERKRLEALARKKQKVIAIGNHKMSLRNRPFTKKT